MKVVGCTAPTMNKKIGLLKAAIEKAVKAGKIARNLLADIERLSDRWNKETWRSANHRCVGTANHRRHRPSF